MGSLLPGSRAERRAPPMGLGGTRTTASPARTRSDPGRRDRCRQSSSAQRRSPNRPPPTAAARGAVRRRPDRPPREPPSLRVHGHRGVPPLVQVRADRHHARVSPPFTRGTAEDRSADTPESGRGHAPIRSRRPVRRVRRAALPMEATPRRRASRVHPLRYVRRLSGARSPRVAPVRPPTSASVIERTSASTPRAGGRHHRPQGRRGHARAGSSCRWPSGRPL